MSGNPYKYVGPLDPERDSAVCVPRKTYVNKVIEGIARDNYWAILGPRMTGKTTFLRQVENEFTRAHYIHIDFDISPKNEESFYNWVIDKIIEEVPPASSVDANEKSGSYGIQSKFFEFLKTFKPKEEKGKIIFLFDHIENCHFLKNFLTIWRTVFHERFRKKELYKYAVIMTSSEDIFELTIGPNSPFNIAESLYLKDFSKEEAEELIDGPFAGLDINVDKKAKKRLISHISGHPQLLQHACSLLVDRAQKEKNDLMEEDIDWAVNSLFKLNSTLRILEEDIRADSELKTLLTDIMNSNKRIYHCYKKFTISGAGPIEEEDSHCKIRSKIYEMFIKNIFTHPVGRYKILSECGKGGMGVVYKAEDLVLGRVVALKILTEDKVDLKRFNKEARTLAQFEHPNVVRIYDIGQRDNSHYISMEFIEGSDLSTMINVEPPFSIAQITYIVKILLKALTYSHKKKIIHRDIKPKNIMINREGEIKIVDFGVAVISDTFKAESTTNIIGTPHYIAPEQIKGGDIDRRTDIYSFGATMFHLITGLVPFDGENSAQILLKHLHQPLPAIKELRPDVPEALIKIVECCMHKKKEDRFQDASDILEEVKTIETEAVDDALIKNEFMSMISKYDTQPVLNM